MANQEASSPVFEDFEKEDISMEAAEESDDELDWEEIAVPASVSTDFKDGSSLSSSAITNGPDQASTSFVPERTSWAGNIEITLKRVKGQGKAKDEARK